MWNKGLMRRLLVACIVVVVMLPLLTAGSMSAAAQAVETKGPVTGLPLPRFVSLRTNEANARRGPGLEHRIDWAYVRRGLPVEVTAEYGNWRRVRDSDGLGGWVHQTLLSGVRTGLVQGEEAVPMRSGRDETDEVRAMVEPGVVVRIRECADGVCRVTAGGTDGWIDQSVMWGVTPGEVIE